MQNFDYFMKDRKEYNNKYNREHKKERKIWRDNNIDYIRYTSSLNYQKNRKLRREQMKKYNVTKYHNDINFKISCLLRTCLWDVLNNKNKVGSAVKDLGCTILELKIHLEKQFKEGMTWNNWCLFGWHIDHIIPLSSFDLTDRNQLLVACNYKNLQPMWAEENLKKGNKLL